LLILLSGSYRVEEDKGTEPPAGVADTLYRRFSGVRSACRRRRIHPRIRRPRRRRIRRRRGTRQYLREPRVAGATVALAPSRRLQGQVDTVSRSVPTPARTIQKTRARRTQTRYPGDALKSTMCYTRANRHCSRFKLHHLQAV